MQTKTLLKIQLRNKGIEVKPKCYQSNGTVVLSFTLPKDMMKKLHKIESLYEFKQGKIFELMLEQFKFKECSIKKTFYSEELDNYIIKNNIKLSKKLKHKNYHFNSRILTLPLYNRIKKIALYYNITRSSLIRILIDHFRG